MSPHQPAAPKAPRELDISIDEIEQPSMNFGLNAMSALKHALEKQGFKFSEVGADALWNSPAGREITDSLLMSYAFDKAVNHAKGKEFHDPELARKIADTLADHFMNAPPQDGITIPPAFAAAYARNKNNARPTTQFMFCAPTDKAFEVLALYQPATEEIVHTADAIIDKILPAREVSMAGKYGQRSQGARGHGEK